MPGNVPVVPVAAKDIPPEAARVRHLHQDHATGTENPSDLRKGSHRVVNVLDQVGHDHCVDVRAGQARLPQLPAEHLEAISGLCHLTSPLADLKPTDVPPQAPEKRQPPACTAPDL